MDLDPMKRKLVTRCIGVIDMILGLAALVINLHTVWDYYLRDIRKTTRQFQVGTLVQNVTEAHREDDLDNVSEQLRDLQLPYYTFVMICVVVFALNLFQIFMGFALQVATFGRNQAASINIATWWLRGSVTLLFLVSLKTIVLATVILSKEMEADWVTFGIGLLELIFRIFSSLWVPKFIAFLKCQSEFDSRCHVIRI